jgi:hypothetical protein
MTTNCRLGFEVAGVAFPANGSVDSQSSSPVSLSKARSFLS